MSEDTQEVRKITQKIIGYRVKPVEVPEVSEVLGLTATPEQLLQTLPTIPTAPTKLERGEILDGSTYKVKHPLYWEHGFYITINNTVVNDVVKPFEIFITSKNSECLPLLEVLSLTITSLFRLQVDIGYLLDEYRTIQDPKGGYRGKKVWLGEKPKYYTSLLGEFADIIEYHLRSIREVAVLAEPIGSDVLHFPSEVLDEIDKVFLEVTAEKGTDIPGAVECPVCHSISYVMLDGCLCCVECSYSKCQ